MDVKLCKRFQNVRLYSWPKGVPKTTQIFSRILLTNHWTDCSEILGYGRLIDTFISRVSKCWTQKLDPGLRCGHLLGNG